MSGPAPATSDAKGMVWRVAYKPDPWAWLPWQFAPFNGRFDDARGQFRVLYVGATRLACFLEVIAQFRPDPAILAELHEVVGDSEDDSYPEISPGIVPHEWLARRTLGMAEISGLYVDIGAKETLSWLRTRLASRLVHYGVTDLDGATVRASVPRVLTQEMSSELYAITLPDGEHPDGVRFESRHGNDLVLHAVFERPGAGDDDHSRLLTSRTAHPIAAGDPELLEAARIHGLSFD